MAYIREKGPQKTTGLGWRMIPWKQVEGSGARAGTLLTRTGYRQPAAARPWETAGSALDRRASVG